MPVPPFRPALRHIVTTTSLYANSRRLLDEHYGVGTEKILPKTDARRLESIEVDIFYR